MAKGKERALAIGVQGRVRKWIGEKGFGFIAVSGRRDVFFHISELSDKAKVLAKGNELVGRDVRMDQLVMTHKGAAARGVKLLEEVHF